MNTETLALDVYGTLINPHAIAKRLRVYLGDQADAFSHMWRTKQLEYSFRRGLMRDYQDFSVVTRDALEYTNTVFSASLSIAEKMGLLAEYTRLDAYEDVPEALSSLRSEGRTLYAFSNGFPGDLDELLAYAGIAHLLDGIVSVHDVRSFKPDPAVYRHFEAVTGTKHTDIRLVSSNAFDITGAQACGWKTAWVKRDHTMVFDSWNPPEAQVVGSLSEL